MFRDLKEYQEIQKIYEDSVVSQCLTEEQEDKIIELIYEDNWTVEQIDELADLLEDDNTLHEGLGKLFTLASKSKFLPKITKFGKGFLGKLRGASKAKQLNLDLKSAGYKSGKFDIGDISKGIKDSSKKFRSKFDRKVTTTSKTLLGTDGKPLKTTKIVNPINKRNAAIAGLVGAGIVTRPKGEKKKETTPTPPPETTKVDTTPTPTTTTPPKDSGVSFGDAIKLNTPPPKNINKTTTTTTTTKPPESEKSTESSKSEKSKKMSQLEKDNRQRFGDERVDFLKQKQKDFKAYRSKKMSRDDFIKKYPKSQTAKDARIRKNPNSREAMMQNSYTPEGTPIQETSGYDPIKNYHLANDLAKVYQKIYEPETEVLDDETRKQLVEHIMSEGILQTAEEANQFIDEQSPEDLQELISEGLMDAVKRVAGNVKTAARAGGDAFKKGVEGGIDNAKKVVSNVKDKVKTAVQTKVQQGRDLATGGTEKLKQGNQLADRIAQKKETLKTQSSGGSGTGSGMSNDPGKTRAQIQFLKNKREKMNNPNQKQLTGRQRAQQMAKDRLGKKDAMANEEFTPYDIVLEYLLSSEQAATIEEANYIMTEMDAKTIQGIISES